MKNTSARSDGTNKRYELVDGKLVEMPPASFLHSDIIDFIADCFEAIASEYKLDIKVQKITVLTLKDGSYTKTVFTKDKALREGTRSVIASPTFPELKLTATEILEA